MIRYGNEPAPVRAELPGLISEMALPGKLEPEFTLGSYATSTFVNGSNDTERKPISGAPAGAGVQPLQLPAVKVNDPVTA